MDGYEITTILIGMGVLIWAVVRSVAYAAEGGK